MNRVLGFVRQNLLGQVIASLLFLFLAFSAAKAVTTISTGITTGGDIYSTDGALFDISSTTAFLVQNGSGTTHFSINTTSATASSTFRGGLVTDTTTLVVNANEDVVGIGTASPSTTLGVLGTSRFNGAVTVAGALTVNGSGLTVSGGSLTLQNSGVIGNSTANNIFVTATTISIATSSASTTAGSLWVAAPALTTTTTINIGGNKTAGDAGSATRGSCIQMWQENVAYKIYVTAGNALVVQAGSCRD